MDIGGSKKICVLVVDDDGITRRIHKMLVSKFGAETILAENGQVAVDLCRSGVEFDLVLMDMEMPIMDGTKATQELRKMGVKSIIVGVTSRGLDLEKQAFIDSGLDLCHDKPLNDAKLRPIFEQLISKKA